MAIRKPYVVGDDGEPQELQSGDNLGDLDSALQRVFTSTALAGHVVYEDSNNSCDLAQANADATARPIGLAVEGVTAPASGPIQLAGVVTLSTGQWDAVTGLTGGLNVGVLYFLSPGVAGQMTETPPTTAGQYLQPMGRALSTIEFNLNIGQRLLRG